MKHPVRPAPAPPFPASENYRMQRSSTQVNKWEDFSSEDPFFMPDFNRPKSVPPDRPAAKKKPPPRPPPPKFAQKPKPNKPNLLMNLFSRQPTTQQPPVRPISSTKQTIRPARKETTLSIATGSLINLNSPPRSPSLTSRSGSDGVSVSSFGSDGPVSHVPHTNTSSFESGFEDDFDFFGGLSSAKVITPVVKDPWSVAAPQDPFSPTRLPIQTKAVLPKALHVVPKPSVSVKPTIIRAKTLVKQPRSVDVGGPSRTKNGLYDETGDWSLPMPSMPPPPLPLDVLKEMELSPDVPPRPMSKHMDTLKKPYGVALYDYAATHPDDLSFQTNDVILLEGECDSDSNWLFGEVDGRHGMFPANFINVMVPLQPESAPAMTANALYAFSPESWEDLEFPEGAEIKLVGRVNSDWLYGEYKGKKGQFPATFVDHIPPNLPQQKV